MNRAPGGHKLKSNATPDPAKKSKWNTPESPIFHGPNRAKDGDNLGPAAKASSANSRLPSYNTTSPEILPTNGEEYIKKSAAKFTPEIEKNDNKHSNTINLDALKGHKFEIRENPDAKSHDSNYLYV